MQLFYYPDISPGQSAFSFDKEESRHIVRVLRKQTGDVLHVTDGKGTLYNVEITSSSDNKCTVRIISSEASVDRGYRLHLAVAPTKLNDRFEWFLEKATEIGIDEITPVICDRSERKIIKRERYEKIVLAAMKQSFQMRLPKVNDAVGFKDFATRAESSVKLIAHCEETDRVSLKNTVKAGENAMILIGPEGDFTPGEISLAKANGFVPITLGPTRLRTETAAVVACHSIAFINES